jgi:biotin transport system substrate-specific component
MTTLAPTLATRYFPRASAWLRDLSLIILAALSVAIMAQVKITLPFTPVPLTGQTFAVLLVGATLGSRRGAEALTLYIMMGALGLPVFAGGASGLAYLGGPTLGYLVGFLVAACLVGELAECGLERSLRTSLLPFLLGTFVIYLFGAGWLALLYGPEQALTLGVLPFLVGDALKIALAALALPGAWRLTE